ncbi:MAG: hypothetical protein ABR924_02040 [Terracidiphilus sp.]|jgi:hypothetical protein
MSFRVRFGNRREEPAEESRQVEPGAGETGDLVLEQALRDFRLSVCAWSEAAYSRPRMVAPVVRRRSWRLAAGWALGLTLAAGGVSGAVFERHQRQEMARAAQEQRLAQERQRLALAEQAREEEHLLAEVDRDVSREVPSAMESLAQLMAEDEHK